MEAEKLVEAESEGHHIGKGSPYRFCKRGTVISAKFKKDNNTEQAKSASDRKSSSKSKKIAKCFTEVTTGEEEQDDLTEQKDNSQEDCKSEKSQPGNERGIKLKSARKKTCYSFQASKKRSSSCSSQSSEMSETLSSLSINLKTRMTNTSSTSLRSAETPVGSSHKLKISNTQDVYRGHNPSSQESSTSPKSIRHPDTPITSFYRLHVSNRQNVQSSEDMSLLESEKSSYDIQQTTNRSAELSERGTSSPDSFVIYPQKWPI